MNTQNNNVLPPPARKCHPKRRKKAAAECGNDVETARAGFVEEPGSVSSQSQARDKQSEGRDKQSDFHLSRR